MDSEPLRHETSEVDFESVSDFERDVLPSLKGSYSDGPLYSIKKSHYWISLLLVFLSGMICMAALVAAQSKPGIGSHTLQSVTEDAAPREVMSLDGRNAKYHLRRFVGTYNATSLYKGPPSPEVDREWQKYWSIWTFGISETDLNSLNAPNRDSAALVTDVSGGRNSEKLYMGTFEAVHQLHCLYNLFRASYRDSNEEERLDFAADPVQYHSRLDHCVDILRQKLECDSDSSVVTYNWVKHRRRPVANFNVEHRCRSWDDLKKFSQQHELVRVPKKPAGVIELEQIP